MFDPKRLLLPVAVLLGLPACDDDPAAPGVEFRDGKNQCAFLQSSSNVIKFGTNGHGPIIGPDVGDPWVPIDELPDEYVAAFHRDMQEQTVAVTSAMFANSRDAQERCPTACREIEGSWTGGGCADGSFRFGELEYAEPTYQEAPRLSVEVDAELQMGCSCAVD